MEWFNLNYLMGYIQLQIFGIVLRTYIIKEQGTLKSNPPIKIFINGLKTE